MHWKIGGASVTLAQPDRGRAVGAWRCWWWRCGCRRRSRRACWPGPPTTCRCARSPPTPRARCCCWSACCWRCRRPASRSARFSVLGGAVGVGLGFGLQKLAANYVSGFVILAERSLRIGDMVKVDNFEGRITDITHPLHRDPRAQRPRVDRAQRDADHAAGRELLAGRPAGVDHDHAAGGLRHRPRRADAATGRARSRPCRACWPIRRPAVQLDAFAADGLDLNVALLDRRPRERPGQRQERRQPRHAAHVNALGVRFRSRSG